MLYRTLSDVARSFRCYAAQRASAAHAAPFSNRTNRSDDNAPASDTASNAVVATIEVGGEPRGVAFNPAGTRAYVANNVSDNVSVIDTASNTVVATVALSALAFPLGIAVNPAGTRVYVANFSDNSVSVRDISHNTVSEIKTHAASYGEFNSER